MVIGICDDKELDRHIIRSVSEALLDRNGWKYEIVEFMCGEELIEYADSNAIDILLLDIEMYDINGIVVKEQLFQSKKNIVIIFVTNYEDYAIDGYGVNVLAYIRKKDIEQMLPVVLSSAIDIVSESTIIENNITSDNITYIKSEHVYCLVYLKNREPELIRCSLKKMEEKLLDFGFVKISRSCIVNMKWIDKLSDTKVIIGDTVLNISTRLKVNVSKKYFEYCEKHAGYY